MTAGRLINKPLPSIHTHTGAFATAYRCWNNVSTNTVNSQPSSPDVQSGQLSLLSWTTDTLDVSISDFVRSLLSCFVHWCSLACRTVLHFSTNFQPHRVNRVAACRKLRRPVSTSCRDHLTAVLRHAGKATETCLLARNYAAVGSGNRGHE